MVSANDGWAVGDHGLIVHWDGQAWQRVPAPTTQPLLTIDMFSGTEGWAGGGSDESGITTALHWDGAAWNLATGLPYAGKIYDIDVLSPTEIWASTGYYAYRYLFGDVIHWNGNTWTYSFIGGEYSGPVTAIAMLSPVDGWAAHWGRALH
jgi:hypothetical protein